MLYRGLLSAVAFAVTLCVTIVDVRAWDDTKYPDLKGQWVRAEGGGARYDLTKPAGRGQEAPRADQRSGRGGRPKTERLNRAHWEPPGSWYDAHGSMLTYNPARGDPGPGNGPVWQGEPTDREPVWRRSHYRGNDPDNRIRQQLMRDR
jgi:hypothetical protein